MQNHETVGPPLMTYDTSMSGEILDTFFAETSEHLQSIEQHLLRLETQPDDGEGLNAVFGAFHSLKGITGFLHLQVANRLAHVAEAILEQARSRAEGIRPQECDAVLRTVDAFREMTHALQEHAGDPSQPFPPLPSSASRLVEELELMAAEAPGETSLPTPALGKDDESAPAPAAEGTGESQERAFVRVHVGKLDGLLDAIGELVILQTQVHQDQSLRQIENPRLMRNLTQLNKITRDLQEVAMSLRMFPLRNTFARMTRLARDLARSQGKDLEVLVNGAESELDKNVIEQLVDPLTHLIRNAVDHGVESAEARRAAGKPERARITLSARHQGSQVVVEVTDDGPGLDYAAITRVARERGVLGAGESASEARLRQLIFEPGFSTAGRLTEVSGRGVGLDVVKRNVEGLGGRITLDSTPGSSSTFRLHLPLTLAIMDGLVLRVGCERYIVPITCVVESFRPTRHQVSTVQEEGELVSVRESHLPLLRLSEFAQTASDARHPWEAIVLIVDCDGERCGVMVDELAGQQQIVIKNLGEKFSRVRGILGGAILSDGRVGLILDVPDLLAAMRHREQAA